MGNFFEHMSEYWRKIGERNANQNARKKAILAQKAGFCTLYLDIPKVMAMRVQLDLHNRFARNSSIKLTFCISYKSARNYLQSS